MKMELYRWREVGENCSTGVQMAESGEALQAEREEWQPDGGTQWEASRGCSLLVVVVVKEAGRRGRWK